MTRGDNYSTNLNSFDNFITDATIWVRTLTDGRIVHFVGTHTNSTVLFLLAENAIKTIV